MCDFFLKKKEKSNRSRRPLLNRLLRLFHPRLSWLTRALPKVPSPLPLATHPWRCAAELDQPSQAQGKGSGCGPVAGDDAMTDAMTDQEAVATLELLMQASPPDANAAAPGPPQPHGPAQCPAFSVQK